MADISFTVTNAGRAALVAAGTAGTLPVVIASCGVSPNALVPSATATALPGEVKRITAVAGQAVSADTIHLTVTDATTDAYDVKSLALYLANGTLFAIYGQSTSILSKSTSAILLIAADVKFADIASSSISFGNTNFLIPPASETVQGVAELATQAETNAGTDDLRIVTPKKLWTAFTAWLATWGADIWRASNDGSGSGLDADLLDGLQGSAYAKKAGETFTGPIESPVIRVDGNAYFRLLNDDPIINFDANDWIVYDRANNVYRFRINSADRVTVANDGLRVSNGTGTATLRANGDINADRGDGTGLLEFGAPGGNQYIHHYNGNSYSFNSGQYLWDGYGGRIWSSANDGGGSGLDADMLDGLHAAAFAMLSQFDFYNDPVGYICLPGRFILQWANVGVSAGGASGFGWRTPFASLLGAGPLARQGLSYSGSYSAYSYNVNNNGGSVFGNNGGGAAGTVTMIGFGTY